MSNEAPSLPPGFIAGVAKVADVSWVTPRLRRLRLVASELVALELGDSPAPAMRLLIASPGSPVVLPTPSLEGLIYPPGVEPLTTRSVTIRCHDQKAGTLDVEVTTGHNGVLSRWAETVSIDDEVGFAGPRLFAPLPTAGPLILLGDDSAVPAIANIIDTRTASSAPSAIIIEVESSEDEVELGVPVTWLHRNGRSPGAALVAGLADFSTAVDAVVWVAGESRMAHAVRKELMDGAVSPAYVRACGYWRSGTSSTELDDGILRLTQDLMAADEPLDVLDEFALALERLD